MMRHSSYEGKGRRYGRARKEKREKKRKCLKGVVSGCRCGVVIEDWSDTKSGPAAHLHDGMLMGVEAKSRIAGTRKRDVGEAVPLGEPPKKKSAILDLGRSRYPMRPPSSGRHASSQAG